MHPSSLDQAAGLHQTNRCRQMVQHLRQRSSVAIYMDYTLMHFACLVSSRYWWNAVKFHAVNANGSHSRWTCLTADGNDGQNNVKTDDPYGYLTYYLTYKKKGDFQLSLSTPLSNDTQVPIHRSKMNDFFGRFLWKC